MNEQDKRYFKSQKRSLDGFLKRESIAERVIKKEKELEEIMEAKYGTDPYYS